MNKSIIALAIASTFAFTGCTRIETGATGVRVDFSKQVKQEELLPGSWNQTLIGDVLIFPVKDVQVDVVDLHPLASDNSTIQDFDMSVIYSLNPASVSELYVDKSRNFHANTEDGDILLMYNYLKQVSRNAAYKTARKYESLKMSDNRQAMEVEIRDTMVEALKAEKLENAINIQQVLIRNVLPAANIVESANMLVQAQNELKRKEVEVQTAKKEAERIAALNANSGAVGYMRAQAELNISEAVKAGKVQTIIIPSNLTMLGNVK